MSLTTRDVPDITADWDQISRFALSFEGYAFAGSREALADLADRLQESFYRHGVLELLPGPGLGCRPMPPTLDELRAALFFEQRSYRWNETEPRGKDLRFMRALIAAIANEVRDREGGTA